jgi:cytoskeletal protein CcmA (bactofilin family)
LRLDPAIAYWAGSNTTVPEQVTINGDVYCNGNLVNDGIIDGDVFASGTISGSGTIIGQATVVAQEPVTWPNLQVSDFGPTYYLGVASYSADIVDANEHAAGSFGPWAANPAGIRYRSGDLELPGGVNIIGTLVVAGELRISGVNNSVTAVKNYPAVLVSGRVVIEDGASLAINGLAQIGQTIVIDAGADNVDVDVIGGLFIANGGIDGISSSSVFIDITAAPAIASIQTWPAGNSSRWGPAGGAFFRSIERR